MVVTGDSTNNYYLIVSGATTAWVLSSAYQGASGSGLSWGTANPNTAHPILVAGINRSEAALVNGVVLIEQLQNFFGNSAVTTGNYNQTIDDLTS